MLNFIICEDNSEVIKINQDIINKVMFNNNFDYKIYSYTTYNDELSNIIKCNIGKKIYLLDIELDSKSGIEIAREIRKSDWNSIILMTTAHTEMFPQVFKDRLMLFDFISKFDNYTDDLYNCIDKIIKIYSTKIPFSFNIRKINHQVSHDEILYLYFSKSERKTILRTISKEYIISKSLKSLSQSLPDNFVQINNHCIVNKNNIKEINENGFIMFLNNVELLDNIKKECRQNVFS